METAEDQSTPMTLAEFGQFVSEGEWTFAKTMPGIPHEYVVHDWYARRGDELTVVRAALFIRKAGRRGQWPAHGRGKYVNWYFEYDGYSYWTIWPIINRARLPLVPQNEVKFLDDSDRRPAKNWMPKSMLGG